MILRSSREQLESRATRKGKGEGEDLGLDHLTLWFSRSDPLYWWYSVVDMERRIVFTSMILLIPCDFQMQIAFLLAVCSIVLSREVGAWWHASSDYLSYYCAWNVVLSLIHI